MQDNTEQLPGPLLERTRPADSLAWMRRDLAVRLIPFAISVGVVWATRRPRWLGISPGRARLQVGVGLAGSAALFAAAAGFQLGLTRRRGALRVPATGADILLQALYYLVNAPLEEAFFRGLLQGGVGARLGPTAGLLAGTVPFVLYHRLGGWRWPDVLATSLVGLPLGLAYRLLPGPPSLLGVSLAHAGATCGFLGPGPWLLHRLRLL